MLAAIFGKILSWLAGKGFLYAIQEALEAVREERIRRDYEEALVENARFDMERDHGRAARDARLRADTVPRELLPGADGQSPARRGKRTGP